MARMLAATALLAVAGAVFVVTWRTVDALPFSVRVLVAGALALTVAFGFATSFAVFQAFV